MTQIVIGLIGSKASGKDTVADIALDKFKAKKKVSFAHCFKKKIMQDIIGFSDYHIDDPKGKEEKLERDVVITSRILRKIIHKTCDLYNIAKNDNILNPYSVAASNWENFKFTKENTYRDVMRYVSTEIIRSICPDWHVVMTLHAVSPDGVTLITDVRFENELQACEAAFKNFFLVYVNNEAAEEKNSDTHISETGFRLMKDRAFETIISEYGKLAELETEAARVFKKIQTVVKREKA